jgi:hypothetical protein
VWAGPGQGVGGPRLAAEILKIDFFHFFYKNMKNPKKSKNRLHFGGPDSAFISRLCFVQN